jgi:sec-independent protein translocase protein TatB
VFDVSLIELAVIALVALLVLGPERLPRAARTVGLYVRKARQSWYSVRADIERELAADELKRSIQRRGDDLRDSIGLDRMREDITGRKRLPAQSAAAPAAVTEPAADAPPETVDRDPAPTPTVSPTDDTAPRA